MKSLIFLLSLLALVLSACSATVRADSAETPPAPVIEAVGYKALQISDVQVEVGVGSPIPVYVSVSGSLPDTCSQVEYSQIERDGSQFNIELSTLQTENKDCVQDSLPFRMSIPLNAIGLPAGEYSVDVNGSPASFTLEGAAEALKPGAVRKDDIRVDAVNVEVGVGSPVPVHAVVSLSLPDSCAQLGEIRLHRDGTTFFVRLIADVSEASGCQADEIPFRLKIPLNTVNLPEGPYEVNVNGATASFDPRTAPAK